MLRKAFKVIGIAVLGAVFALGALAVSVVYIIPGMLAHEPEQKIALNSISCPPGMVENMRTGRCTTSEESMTRVAVAFAQLEEKLSHRIDRDPVFVRKLAQSARQDAELSFKLFHLAAVMGDAESQYILGGMLSKGEGTEEDDHESLQWLYESAQRGFSKAQLRISYMLSAGEFIEKDEVEAINWLKRAEKSIPSAKPSYTGA